MANSQRFDPALLTEGQRNKEAEFNEFRNCEMPVQFFPQRVIRDIGVPDNGARVRERHLLSLGKLVRAFKVEKVVILGFGESLPSTLDGPLDSSILAVDRFGDVDAADFLDAMFEDAVSKCEVPRLRESPDDVGVVCPDRLAFGAGRAFPARPFEVSANFRIVNVVGIDVRNTRHDYLLVSFKQLPQLCSKLSFLKQFYCGSREFAWIPDRSIGE